MCEDNTYQRSELSTSRYCVLILCKFERIFLPAFFGVMVRLVVHLAAETKIVGLVRYSWMYPIERSLLTLRQYVWNKACPEFENHT